MASIARSIRLKPTPDDSDRFWELDRRRHPIKWRDLTVSTPYFAAVDFKNQDSPTGSNFEVASNPRKPQEDGGGSIFDALRHYGITGWSPKFSEK